ncbi:MAG: aminopeptidase P family protein [Winogradskyella sp.]|uniref:M24 family metallopeptidase n=1 Tax=Winogradskyella sp. TaxID=1883156 RepID=UPI0017DEB3D7|nr:M24 family metallopeptidase [Winogradskyella sp.]MBT8244209.1 M24 family metallopeptidase [Winogradskyella sp.]NNK21701.1 aminopeptidase P family protein [Winogradskyella sp.]
MKRFYPLLLLITTLTIGCSDSNTSSNSEVAEINPETYWGESPWPEIRKERINTLLPNALKNANVDAWLTICRENNNDPIADHIGGENASVTAVFLFYNDEIGFHSKVFSPSGEATALDDLDIHDEVVSVERGTSAVKMAVDFIKEKDFKTIAVNSSGSNSIADGLSYTQRKDLEDLLADYSERLVPSTDVVYEWLSIKLPAEVDVLRKAAQLTADWQIEAYKQVEPGKSTDADIAKFLKQKMTEYGVKDGWAPDQNPNVNSGEDRGHSHATDKVIMPGDVIQIDFGIKVYDRWVSDIQRFAYVLKNGETEAPKDILHYWESGKAGNRAALAAMKPGVKGVDVDRAQRVLMEKAGSDYVMWSTGHPVGYVAHDVGPNLGGSQASHVRQASEKIIKEGMTFAFDGFHAWKLKKGGVKTISVEEMAVVKKDGAKYLIEPQEELILISPKE